MSCQNSMWSSSLKAASFSSSVSHCLDISTYSTTDTGVFVVLYFTIPTTCPVSRLRRTTSRASCPQAALSPSSTRREIKPRLSDPFLDFLEGFLDSCHVTTGSIHYVSIRPSMGLKLKMTPRNLQDVHTVAMFDLVNLEIFNVQQSANQFLSVQGTANFLLIILSSWVG